MQWIVVIGLSKFHMNRWTDPHEQTCLFSYTIKLQLNIDISSLDQLIDKMGN